jgi:hypothetical protein
MSQTVTLEEGRAYVFVAVEHRVREEQTMPRIAIDPTLAATLPLAA